LIKAWKLYPRRNVATDRFQQNGQPRWFPDPPYSKAEMTKRKNSKTLVRFRTMAHRKDVWTRAAARQGKTLSSFVRDASDAAAIEMVDFAALDGCLRSIRESINGAIGVRTDEQRRERLEEVLETINTIIRRGLPRG
jgi:hypothetical protein